MIKETSNQLAKEFDITIYCADDKPGKYIHGNIPVYVFQGYRRGYYFSPSLYKEVKKVKCDLFHVHNFQSLIPLTVSIAKADKKIVFSPHFHPIGSTSPNTMLRKCYEPVVGPFLFKSSDLIICFSNTEKHLLINRFGKNLIKPDKTRVIYHGANFYEVENAKPFDLSGKIILYVGRLERYKNVQIIIESLRFLPKEYQLFIIGEGTFEFTLKQIAHKLNLMDRVKFLGYLSDRLMYRWLKTCSVLVQLSKIESGISLTCIDALAAEKPVIVNNDFVALRETAELFKGHGVFPFNTEEGSAQELAKLIQNASMVRAKADLSEFNWSMSARKIRDAYLEALNSST